MKLRRRRRTEITVDTRRVVVVRDAATAMLARCPECRREVRMVAVDAAAQIAGVSARTMYRWVDENKVHFIETPAEQLLVCAESLRARC